MMTIVFGTGYFANRIIYFENELDIQYFIDNDIQKIGKQFGGYDIKHPEEIIGDEYDQIVITSEKYEFEMRRQLLDLGVEESKIVNGWELEDRFISDYEETENVLEEHKTDDSKDVIKIRTSENYRLFQVDENLVQFENILSKMVLKSSKKIIYYPGRCNICKKTVDMRIDNFYSGSPLKVNFRERLACPICNLNNRQRKIAELILDKASSESVIYLTEQVTEMYSVLKEKFDNLIGSEFLGTDMTGGTISEEGIRHEDLTNLSFDDEVFDYVISCDVLEHVGDAVKAFREIHRVLKNDGVFYATFPMNFNEEHTVKRAALTEAGIEYFHEPVYHGNPISTDGSLVFYDYGFDLMDMVKAAGFSDAYFMPFYSIPDGHIGIGTLFIFVAQK